MEEEYALRVDLVNRMKEGHLEHKDALSIVSIWIQQPYFKDLLFNEDF
jgi:hypothetical protein